MARREKPTPATTGRAHETPPPGPPVVPRVTLPETVGETTITGKNQISLPVRGVRRLGWAKGDRVLMQVQGGRMILWRRPENWADYFAGKMDHVFGDHEDTLRYLDEVRYGCEERAEEHGA
jgi:bifunctional DNA-binding transcriptional regulator/antitoxin component of YhaV-PrlF toxin-antitoxin module